MTTGGIDLPSRQAAMMLSGIANMSDSQLELARDLGLGIAAVMDSVVAMIENPPKKVVRATKGAEVIQLCSHLVPATQFLKKDLDAGELDLIAYLRRLTAITDELSDLTEKNYSVMVSSSVREHMKNMANMIVLDVEGGAVLNTMFNILGTELDGDYPA